MKINTLVSNCIPFFCAGTAGKEGSSLVRKGLLPAMGDKPRLISALHLTAGKLKDRSEQSVPTISTSLFNRTAHLIPANPFGRGTLQEYGIIYSEKPAHGLCGKHMKKDAKWQKHPFCLPVMYSIEKTHQWRRLPWEGFGVVRWNRLLNMSVFDWSNYLVNYQVWGLRFNDCEAIN